MKRIEIVSKHPYNEKWYAIDSDRERLGFIQDDLFRMRISLHRLRNRAQEAHACEISSWASRLGKLDEEMSRKEVEFLRLAKDLREIQAEEAKKGGEALTTRQSGLKT